MRGEGGELRRERGRKGETNPLYPLVESLILCDGVSERRRPDVPHSTIAQVQTQQSEVSQLEILYN